MRNLSRKIIIAVIAPTIILSALLTGCSDPVRPEFKPPQYPSHEPRFIYERSIRSSADIREITTAMKFQFIATGTSDTATGLAKPFDIAVRKGIIYVSDTVQRSVVVFDAPTGKARYIGEQEGPGQLLKPLGIDIDKKGNLYVADVSDKNIKVYSENGDFLRSLNQRSLFDRPTGVAISPDGNTLYVIDSGGISSTRHHLHIFDAHTFELKRTVGKRGTDEGDFNLPIQVTTTPEGLVYVVDGGNFRVQVFSAEGDFISTFGSVGRRSGNFSRPKGIAADSDNNIYVSDSAFGNFQIFSSTGQLLLHVGDRGNRGGPGMFMLPSGIDVDEDGRVYFADQFFRKIDIFRPASITKEDGYLGSKYKDEVRAEIALRDQ